MLPSPSTSSPEMSSSTERPSSPTTAESLVVAEDNGSPHVVDETDPTSKHETTDSGITNTELDNPTSAPTLCTSGAIPEIEMGFLSCGGTFNFYEFWDGLCAVINPEPTNNISTKGKHSMPYSENAKYTECADNMEIKLASRTWPEHEATSTQIVMNKLKRVVKEQQKIIEDGSVLLSTEESEFVAAASIEIDTECRDDNERGETTKTSSPTASSCKGELPAESSTSPEKATSPRQLPSSPIARIASSFSWANRSKSPPRNEKLKTEQCKSPTRIQSFERLKVPMLKNLQITDKEPEEAEVPVEKTKKAVADGKKESDLRQSLDETREENDPVTNDVDGDDKSGVREEDAEEDKPAPRTRFGGSQRPQRRKKKRVNLRRRSFMNLFGLRMKKLLPTVDEKKEDVQFDKDETKEARASNITGSGPVPSTLTVPETAISKTTSTMTLDSEDTRAEVKANVDNSEVVLLCTAKSDSRERTTTDPPTTGSTAPTSVSTKLSLTDVEQQSGKQDGVSVTLEKPKDQNQHIAADERPDRFQEILAEARETTHVNDFSGDGSVTKSTIFDTSVASYKKKLDTAQYAEVMETVEVMDQGESMVEVEHTKGATTGNNEVGITQVSEVSPHEVKTNDTDPMTTSRAFTNDEPSMTPHSAHHLQMTPRTVEGGLEAQNRPASSTNSDDRNSEESATSGQQEAMALSSNEALVKEVQQTEAVASAMNGSPCIKEMAKTSSVPQSNDDGSKLNKAVAAIGSAENKAQPNVAQEGPSSFSGCRAPTMSKVEGETSEKPPCSSLRVTASQVSASGLSTSLVMNTNASPKNEAQVSRKSFNFEDRSLSAIMDEDQGERKGHHSEFQKRKPMSTGNSFPPLSPTTTERGKSTYFDSNLNGMADEGAEELVGLPTEVTFIKRASQQNDVPKELEKERSARDILVGGFLSGFFDNRSHSSGSASESFASSISTKGFHFLTYEETVAEREENSWNENRRLDNVRTGGAEFQQVLGEIITSLDTARQVDPDASFLTSSAVKLALDSIILMVENSKGSESDEARSSLMMSYFRVKYPGIFEQLVRRHQRKRSCGTGQRYPTHVEVSPTANDAKILGSALREVTAITKGFDANLQIDKSSSGSTTENTAATKSLGQQDEYVATNDLVHEALVSVKDLYVELVSQPSEVFMALESGLKIARQSLPFSKRKGWRRGKRHPFAFESPEAYAENADANESVAKKSKGSNQSNNSDPRIDPTGIDEAEDRNPFFACGPDVQIPHSSSDAHQGPLVVVKSIAKFLEGQKIAYGQSTGSSFTSCTRSSTSTSANGQDKEEKIPPEMADDDDDRSLVEAKKAERTLSYPAEQAI